MVKVNEEFLKLPASYLFVEVAERVKAYKASDPEAQVISLGIGDVTLPLPHAVLKAMHGAVDEMGEPQTFRGYGPERGYEFLRRTIVDNDFASRCIEIGVDEVFVNDGAKSDTGNFQELLGSDVRIAVTDPIYPVYVDSNAMSGRAGSLAEDGHWSKVCYMPCTAENGFVPALPNAPVDVIYLCYPNNPTGTTISRSELKKWVDYAREHGALILYDAAYEAYIRHEDVPHSIYEIDGAREVAVEFHSFSKTAGFTGIRCGYTVVPRNLTVRTSTGQLVSLNALWTRRQSTKFNGTSYISQRAAEAVYSEEGRREVKAMTDYYMHNAEQMRDSLGSAGLTIFGGEDAPYLWVKTPDGLSSWEFFDLLLKEAQVVCTPGVGFGPAGEGYVRLTAFGEHGATNEALKRIKTIIGK